MSGREPREATLATAAEHYLRKPRYVLPLISGEANAAVHVWAELLILTGLLHFIEITGL